MHLSFIFIISSWKQNGIESMRDICTQCVTDMNIEMPLLLVFSVKYTSFYISWSKPHVDISLILFCVFWSKPHVNNMKIGQKADQGLMKLRHKGIVSVLSYWMNACISIQCEEIEHFLSPYLVVVFSIAPSEKVKA